MYGERLARWERIIDWPLMGAAVAFLIAYAAQILFQPAGLAAAVAEGAIYATWAMFALDYVVRLVIAQPRWQWFYRHLLDLAIVVLPMLRPLRLMRFLTVLAIVHRGAGTLLRGRVLTYTVGATALTIIIAGLAVLDAERGQPGSNIETFGEALWWAIVTITTVGYGDFYPVTDLGRLIAFALMLGGIALIGVVTATLASWIVERVSLETQTSATATEEQVEALRTEIADLKDMIRGLSRSR
ncbi:voltage-gated potassium channel [Microbacterium sp. SLBN-154]|uniref:potassium channel family protein n=1 Tax=Microbacterium sp. SLBN-154 TaxID=2768458 RepID=UPI001168B121|nr:potassium channel family protein [Microbacterium sp. SLBN-154]TQK18617.1 voltage-gated potassium channel [Microbacterium sp. SLBN-154]